MSIKYEIHGIKNAKGEGKEQKYVHLFAHEPQSDHALERRRHSSSLGKRQDCSGIYDAFLSKRLHTRLHTNTFVTFNNTILPNRHFLL